MVDADLGPEPRPVGQPRVCPARRAGAGGDGGRAARKPVRPAVSRGHGHGWKRAPRSRLPAARQRLEPPGGRHPERLEDLLACGGQGAGGAGGAPGGGGGGDQRTDAAAGEPRPQGRAQPPPPGLGRRAATSGCVLAWKESGQRRPDTDSACPPSRPAKAAPQPTLVTSTITHRLSVGPVGFLEMWLRKGASLGK